MLPSYGNAIVIGLGVLFVVWLLAYINPSTRPRAKWWGLRLIAALFALGALAYGKRTVSTLDAKAKEHNARGKLLNAERAAALQRAEATEDEEERAAHIERAETLSLSAAEINRQRLKLISDTGDLQSDAERVRADLDRRNSGTG